MIQIIQPEVLSHSQLDDFLEQGFFRASDSLQRSDVVCNGISIHTPINIRLPLDGHSFRKTHRRLLRKNGSKFTYTISNLELTPEAERLYGESKEDFQGFICENLKTMLLGYTENSPFDTKMICVYDGETLVACSFFDIALSSIASVTGLYDKRYRKYGLGIYTMLLEIEEAKKRGMSHYYPGYVFNGNPKMDYKLTLGRFQFQDPLHGWQPIVYAKGDIGYSYQFPSKIMWPDEFINHHTDKLIKALKKLEVATKNILYPLSEIRKLELEGFENARNPRFIDLGFNLYAEYDRYTELYRFFVANYAKGPINDIIIRDSMFSGTNCYRESFIGYEQFLFCSKSSVNLAEFASYYVNSLKNHLLGNNIEDKVPPIYA